MADSLFIRCASMEDMPVLHDLVRELARYEHLEASLETNAESLGDGIFGPHSTTEVLLAFWDDQPAGMAVYFHNFSTFVGRPGIFLEDLFVKEEFRRKGIATALLKEVASIAHLRECGRLEWTVLDWNTSAQAFYEAIGARMLTDWRIMRMDRQAIQSLANS